MDLQINLYFNIPISSDKCHLTFFGILTVMLPKVSTLCALVGISCTLMPNHFQPYPLKIIVITNNCCVQLRFICKHDLLISYIFMKKTPSPANLISFFLSRWVVNSFTFTFNLFCSELFQIISSCIGSDC